MADQLPRFRWQRTSLASEPDTPPTTLLRLAVESSQPLTGEVRVRRAIAGNPQAPSGLLAVLALDPDPRVRLSVAVNSATPVVAVAGLAQDSDDRVRSSARHNITVTTYLEQSAPTKRLGSVNEAIASLVHSSGADLLRQIGYRPPSEVLAVLAHSADADVRRSVAWHRNADADTLAFLSNLHDASVCQAIAQHRNASPDILSDLLDRDTVAWVHATPLPTGNLIHSIQAKWRSVPASIASNENATGELLVRLLARHPDEVVRQTVAEHANTLIKTLNELADDESLSVVTRVAINRNTSPEALARISQRRPTEEWSLLANDPRPHVATNPNAPADVLRRLAEMGYHSKVASNRSAPPALLARIGQKNLQEWSTAYSLANNPATPPQILSAIAEEHRFDESVVHSVAAHANTPAATLTDLVKGDNMSWVRETALRNLQLRAMRS